LAGDVLGGVGGEKGDGGGDVGVSAISADTIGSAESVAARVVGADCGGATAL